MGYEISRRKEKVVIERRKNTMIKMNAVDMSDRLNAEGKYKLVVRGISKCCGKDEGKEVEIDASSLSIDQLGVLAGFFDAVYDKAEIDSMSGVKIEKIPELREVELHDGNIAKVLSARGYNDGYYWDCTCEVEVNGVKYTIQDAGSGSLYIPVYSSISVDGPCKLTGAEMTEIEASDESEWEYFESTINDLYKSFVTSGAKKSYEYACNDYFDSSTHVDGEKVEESEDEE